MGVVNRNINRNINKNCGKKNKPSCLEHCNNWVNNNYDSLPNIINKDLRELQLYNKEFNVNINILILVTIFVILSFFVYIGINLR